MVTNWRSRPTTVGRVAERQALKLSFAPARIGVMSAAAADCSSCAFIVFVISTALSRCTLRIKQHCQVRGFRISRRMQRRCHAQSQHPVCWSIIWVPTLRRRRAGRSGFVVMLGDGPIFSADLESASAVNANLRGANAVGRAVNSSVSQIGDLIFLPKEGGAVRGLGETFSPDLLTGTGNLSVPIAVLRGRSGLTPAQLLGYSTGAGNGLFGLGWAQRPWPIASDVQGCTALRENRGQRTGRVHAVRCRGPDPCPRRGRPGPASATDRGIFRHFRFVPAT